MNKNHKNLFSISLSLKQKKKTSSSIDVPNPKTFTVKHWWKKKKNPKTKPDQLPVFNILHDNIQTPHVLPMTLSIKDDIGAG